MKIMVVGEFRWEIYEKPLFEAFNTLGYETYKFAWKDYFAYSNKISEISCKIQGKYHFGPRINLLNQELVKQCELVKPDLVFVYRGVVIKKETILAIKQIGAKVFGYNNDDPFDNRYSWYVYKIYLEAISAYDAVFSYREKNIIDYGLMGIKSDILRSYYLDNRNFYIPRDNKYLNKYKCEVQFIGHYENDRRDELLVALLRKGIDLKLYGARWGESLYYSELAKPMGEEITQLRTDYNLALNACKIALVFLSKLNNDTYTRRCFEIPATKTFMLCEYTDDMASMFEPDIEAVYFKNKEEFLEKVTYYLEHEVEREIIAENGYKRLLKDGHEIKDRARQIINKYKDLCHDNC